MFGRSIPLFRLFGITIRIDFSWFPIALLVAWSLASGLFPARYPELAGEVYWLMGVAGSLGLFLSVLLHEMAHALVAQRRGVPINQEDHAVHLRRRRRDAR